MSTIGSEADITKCRVSYNTQEKGVPPNYGSPKNDPQFQNGIIGL